MTSYHTHLDRLMTELGIENQQLAATAGTTRQAVHKLRRGITRMLPHWAKRLAPRLGVSWQELVEGAPDLPERSRVEWMAAYDALSEDKRQAFLAVFKTMAPAEQAAAPSGPGRAKPRAVGGVTPRLRVRAQRT